MPARAKFEFTAQDRTKRGIDSVKSRLRGLAKFAKATAAAGAAAAGAAAIGLRTRAADAKQIAATARSLGISTQEVQAFGFAAEKAGASADQMFDGIKDSSERIGEFLATGTGEAADVLNDLIDIGDVSKAQLSKWGPTQRILEFMRIADRAQTQAARTRILDALVGEGGFQALSRMKSVSDLADKLGRGLDMADKPGVQSGLEQLNAELETMSENFRIIGKTITDQLIGPATEAVKQINALLERPGEATGKLAASAGRAAKRTLEEDAPLVAAGMRSIQRLQGSQIGGYIPAVQMGAFAQSFGRWLAEIVMQDKKGNQILMSIRDNLSSGGAVAQ